MSIVDLSSRLTNDWVKAHQSQYQTDSFVYTNDLSSGTDSPVSIELKVGNVCMKPGRGKNYVIGKKGLRIRPKETWVIYTAQSLFCPLNVYGVVTGKGSLIFRGCFISTGKIDPGFGGQLKIAIYNGGNKSITLIPGEEFATAFFISMEATLPAPLEEPIHEYQTNPHPQYSTYKWYNKVGDWVKQSWGAIIASALAILEILQLLSIV